MNDVQKAQALALRKIEAVRKSGVPTAYVSERVGNQGISTPVPNLADETGAVEGVLHRVLTGIRRRGERAQALSLSDDDYPTEAHALVAALLAAPEKT